MIRAVSARRAAIAVALGFAALLSMGSAATVLAQVPTPPPPTTQPPQTTAPPQTTTPQATPATTVAPSTTKRTTTTIPPTTTTPEQLPTLPPVTTAAPAPGATTLTTTDPTGAGQDASLSPWLPALSIAGFVVALVLIATQWVLTRRPGRATL